MNRTDLIARITKRLRLLDYAHDPLMLAMDLEFASNAQGATLDIEALATSNDADLLHDVDGVYRTTYREPGRYGEIIGFTPRCGFNTPAVTPTTAPEFKQGQRVHIHGIGDDWESEVIGMSDNYVMVKSRREGYVRYISPERLSLVEPTTTPRG